MKLIVQETSSGDLCFTCWRLDHPLNLTKVSIRLFLRVLVEHWSADLYHGEMKCKTVLILKPYRWFLNKLFLLINLRIAQVWMRKSENLNYYTMNLFELILRLSFWKVCSNLAFVCTICLPENAFNRFCVSQYYSGPKYHNISLRIAQLINVVIKSLLALISRKLMGLTSRIFN